MGLLSLTKEVPLKGEGLVEHHLHGTFWAEEQMMLQIAALSFGQTARVLQIEQIPHFQTFGMHIVLAFLRPRRVGGNPYLV